MDDELKVLPLAKVMLPLPVMVRAFAEAFTLPATVNRLVEALFQVCAAPRAIGALMVTAGAPLCSVMP